MIIYRISEKYSVNHVVYNREAAYMRQNINIKKKEYEKLFETSERHGSWHNGVLDYRWSTWSYEYSRNGGIVELHKRCGRQYRLCC